MEKLDWNLEGLRNGCILAGIAHAIGVARYPVVANEHSWDEENYSVQDSAGSRGTVSFAKGYCVGVFRNEKTRRAHSDFKSALEYLQNAPEEVIELAKEEALHYVLDFVDDEDEAQSVITTAFWGNADGFYTNDTFDDFLEYGGFLLERQVMDTESAIREWTDEYEFEECEIALLKRLYERKIAAPDARIILTGEELSMLNSDDTEGIEESEISFEELNIYFEDEENEN